MSDANQVITYNSQWLEKVAAHSADLRELIAHYHPAVRHRDRMMAMPITAPNAEAACAVVREKIAAERPDDPVARFDKALAQGDVSELMSVMDGAWFGVPESTTVGTSQDSA